MGHADRKALRERRKCGLGLPYIFHEEDTALKKKGHRLWGLTESPSWSYAPLGKEEFHVWPLLLLPCQVSLAFPR